MNDSIFKVTVAPVTSALEPDGLLHGPGSAQAEAE